MTSFFPPPPGPAHAAGDLPGRKHLSYANHVELVNRLRVASR